MVNCGPHMMNLTSIDVVLCKSNVVGRTYIGGNNWSVLSVGVTIVHNVYAQPLTRVLPQTMHIMTICSYVNNFHHKFHCWARAIDFQ